MFGYRITDEVREHMFDRWSQKNLQSMADYHDWTVPELKERLLEFAAFHDIDTLDSFLVGSNGKVNTISQLDGAPDGVMDCDTIDDPRTPTMSSPMSRQSDDSESIFDFRASLLTTPLSQHTPTKLSYNASPNKHEDSKYTRLMCQTDGFSSGLTKTLADVQVPSDGSVVSIDGRPIVRLFDPEMSLRHRDVSDENLLAYNHKKSVMNLCGIEPSTGALQIDPQTLVISIEGVVCEDGQAGAAVFFHQNSPWNTVTCVESTMPQTKENAKLEALYVALHMIRSTAAVDPFLKAVRIMCVGREFCIANTMEEPNLGGADREAVEKWLQEVDEATFWEINQFWKDIAKGGNGQRALDVRLWNVSDETVRPVTEMTLAYMYERHDHDWYRENGKAHDHFEVHSPKDLKSSSYGKWSSIANAKAMLEESLGQRSIFAPQAVIDRGPRAVSQWITETKAQLQQDFLYTILAPDSRREINDEVRSSRGELQSTEEFLKAHARSTRIMVFEEEAQERINKFMAEQRVIWQNNPEQDQYRAYGSTGGNQDDETGEDGLIADKLVKQVLEMDWE
ncbi:hypothetical protein N8I77_011830 [Diaporthe amygdali]|uniref:Uncharacterized protein n=1 Tax=Phomopsis amygdali TaxID=1214568 RepID=A0AAD9VXU2_PHOAM|nr:hypothetical protein N8I77_011830 [Diaporthe amygdali]